MGKEIKVTPSEMRAAAASIDGMISIYKSKYEGICKRVERLGNSWKGKDNTAFTERINEFKPSFTRLEVLLEDYTDFLRTSAQTYEDNQKQVMDRARELEQTIR